MGGDPGKIKRIGAIGDRLVVGLFLLGISLPLADRFLGLDHTALVENRPLAARPARPTAVAELPAYTEAFDAYWRDNFGFRRQLIRWYAIARYRLGVSVSPRVLIGKQGSLFYTGEDAITAFRGLLPLPEKTLEAWHQELVARRTYLEKRGIRYLFVVAPNKESVLPELVPDRLTRVGPTPLDQLLWYLSTRPSKLEVLDLRKPLTAAKATAPVFLRTDTHWNDHGSFVTYNAILDSLRPWHPALKPRPLSSFTRRTGRPISGDLAAMLGLTDVITEPLHELVPSPPPASRAARGGGPKPPDSRRFRILLGPAELPRAVVLHDSFFLAPDERGDPGQPARTDEFMPRDSAFRLAALLAENFSRTIFSWQHTLDLALIEREKPAFVIQEIVERSLPAGPLGHTPAR